MKTCSLSGCDGIITLFAVGRILPSYCDAHRCSSNCPNRRSRTISSAYCDDHECINPLCNDWKPPNFESCFLHRCSEPSCRDQRAALSNFCSRSHQCEVSTCRTIRTFASADSRFCARHTCLVTDCYNLRLAGVDVCNIWSHECSYPGCHNQGRWGPILSTCCVLHRCRFSYPSYGCSLV